MKSKMDPLVSVVIPVYNVESYLHECVKSVVEQTYTNIWTSPTLRIGPSLEILRFLPKP